MNSKKFESTALHAAIIENDIAQVKNLLERGADINAIDGYENTPLHYALSSKKVESEELIALVKFLISKGADLNIFNQAGKSALYYLLIIDYIRESEDLMFTFMQHNANINLINSDKDNVLHIYLKHGGSNKRIIALFKQLGGDINQSNTKRQTPLAAFLESSSARNMDFCLDIFKYLVSEGAMDYLNDIGENALLSAIRAGQELIVKHILETKFSDVQNVTNEGLTGLHYAAKFSTGIFNILSIMLNILNVNTIDFLGRTPLLLVVQENGAFAQQIVEKLLEHKADINIRDAFNNSPLLYSISNGNTEMTTLLMARGAVPFHR